MRNVVKGALGLLRCFALGGGSARECVQQKAVVTNERREVRGLGLDEHLEPPVIEISCPLPRLIKQYAA